MAPRVTTPWCANHTLLRVRQILIECYTMNTNLHREQRRVSIDDATPDEWNQAAQKSLFTPQQAPVPSQHPAAWSLVIADMANRDAFGASKYGVRLQPGNGRDNLVDAYQEVLDLAVYLRAAIYERDMALNKTSKV